MICPKCGIDSESSSRCSRCGHNLAPVLFGEKFGSAAVKWLIQGWFWVKTILVFGAAILVYDRATTPFELVMVSIALLIYSRLGNLKLEDELSSSLETAQMQ